MDRKEMMRILENTVGLIHQHHATNLCDSYPLFDQSKELVRVLKELYKEKPDMTCWDLSIAPALANRIERSVALAVGQNMLQESILIEEEGL